MAERLNPLTVAEALAEQHNMYIRRVTQRGKGAYVLYRKNPLDPRHGFRICRRASKTAILSAVKFAAGVAGPKHDPQTVFAPAEESAF